MRTDGNSEECPNDCSQAGPIAALRAGVIGNYRSHRNRTGIKPTQRPGLLYASPATHRALVETLRTYARKGVNLVVIDGGDGTVRDVITATAEVFDNPPRFALVPSGKTNALALDLGIPRRWEAHHAIQAAGAGRFQARSPIEIARAGSSAPVLRGFLFGAGRFVDGTELAQKTHSAGAFDGAAVALSLGWSVIQTLFGGRNNRWKLGQAMQIRMDDRNSAERSLYLFLASTLERMPLGLKPFGPIRDGLKVLTIDAPPRRLWAALLPLLAGLEHKWLRQAGYRRTHPGEVRIALEGGFILDGEYHEGGEFLLRTGEPLHFAVP
jgi:diacylglycerol kinase family enzyme